MVDFIFLAILFGVAILYSSVGHGGASGYLALMALFGISTVVMRPSALVLNLFVSAISFYSFYRNNHFKFSLLWPFIVTSVPFSFWGGTISIEPKIYKVILGIFLFIAILRMFASPKKTKEHLKQINRPIAAGIGIFLGFLSGLIGIGGGIILSPILLLLGWANMKQTAAVSAAFIFVNSSAGLSGMLLQEASFDPGIAYMVLASVAGGLIGSNLGSFRFSNTHLQYALGVVLFFASIKLIVL